MAARSDRSPAATKKKAPTAPKASAAKPAAKAAIPTKAGAKTAAAPARPAARPAPKAAKPAPKAAEKPSKAAPSKAAPSKSTPSKATRTPVETKSVTKATKGEAKTAKTDARPVRAPREAAAPLVVKKPASAGGKKGEPVSPKKGRHEEVAAPAPRKGDTGSKKAPVEARGGGKKGAAGRQPAPSGSKRPNVDRSPTPPRTVSKPPPRLSLRPPPPPRQPTLEERSSSVETRLARTSEEFRKAYIERVDMSWIFHDAALEGVVYTEQELRAALDPNAPPVPPESSLKPIVEEIRRHRAPVPKRAT